MQQQAPATRPAAGTLRVLAQTPAEWAQWAQHLSAALGAHTDDDLAPAMPGGRWRVGAVASPVTLDGAVLAAPPSRTRWILFVDSPARHLALHAGIEPDLTPQDLLGAWCASARQALAVIHALRGQCQVFDSDETLSNPSAVAHCLSGWLGVDLPDHSWPLAPARNGLIAQLGEEFAQSDRRATELWSELLACCSPLPGVPPASLVGEVQQQPAADRLLQAQALVAAAVRVTELVATEGVGQRALAAAQAELATVRATLTDHRQQLQDERERTTNAKEVREEADLLLMQLQHVQEELQTQFLTLQSARQELAVARQDADARKRQPDGLGFSVLARRTVITGARTERPHCELELAFHDVTLGSLRTASVAVRLVEHEGRAGLALVALHDVAPPITQWAPDGEDSRGAYMLFIPADARGPERLAALGTRNWQTLRGQAALVQQAVADGALDGATYWQRVAARVCVALEAIPPRLRYNTIAVQPEGGAITVLLDGACFGNRALPPVALRWTPANRGAPLHWLCIDERTPCLAAWPVGADGSLAPELPLPVSHATGLGSRLRWWTQLLPADRELALGLVDTLAAVPGLLPRETDGRLRAELQSQAARLRSDLHRTVKLGRWARQLRRALRGRHT